MREIIVTKQETDATLKGIHRHDQAEEKWRGSAERKTAMEKYPGEYVAVLGLDVFAHSKDKKDVFNEVRRKNGAGTDLLSMVTDKMVPERDFFELMDEIIDSWDKDPIDIALRDLNMKIIYGFTREELDRPFTI